MLSGVSSDFISSVSEFVNQNNKPLSVTLISDGMSRSFYNVLGFEQMDNLMTGVGFYKMKKVGGIDTFFSTENSVGIEAIADLGLNNFVSSAISSGILNLIPNSRTLDEGEAFAVKMPENHVSSVFFGMNPTRPGYIIDTGDDPDDIFELDENRGNMIVYVNELSVGSDLYYHFFPQDGFYMRNTGIYGLGVEIAKRENLSDDVIMI
jgi:hypothetical protein